MIEIPLCETIYEFLVKHKAINKRQFAYQKSKGTEDTLRILTGDIKEALCQNLLVGAVFVDLLKAFDTVDRTRLMCKLHKFGVIGKIYSMHVLTNDFTNRKITTMVSNTYKLNT